MLRKLFSFTTLTFIIGIAYVYYVAKQVMILRFREYLA